MILSASCGIEGARVVPYKPLLDEAIKLAKHKPPACMILQRPQCEAPLTPGRDHDWRKVWENAVNYAKTSECVPVAATDPLYILYTSGTTGIPKGVVRDNGGHMVALKWSMQNLYGISPGEVWWSGSDIGWVVGHSYIVYAPLFHGCTIDPLRGQAGRHARRRRVLAPDRAARRGVAVHRAHRLPRHQEGRPEGRASSRNTTCRNSARCSWPASAPIRRPSNGRRKCCNVPVIDHWWQTETGWCIAGNPVGLGALPVRYGSACVPMPGYAIDIVDEANKVQPANKIGSIVVKLPLPPACFPTLWQQDERFKESYLAEFPGYYKTADAGYKDDDGYVYVMSRTDDIINVAGHRLSTGGMEEVLASHQDVAECAVLGIKDDLKGEVPCGFIVLKAGVNRPPAEIEKEIVALVREKIGPVAAFKLAITVARLPKTRSGKILRGTIKKIADGDPWTMPATIDDPAIFDEIGSAMKGKGVGG